MVTALLWGKVSARTLLVPLDRGMWSLIVRVYRGWMEGLCGFFLPLKGSGLAIGDHGVCHVSYSLNSLKGIIQGII